MHAGLRVDGLQRRLLVAPSLSVRVANAGQTGVGPDSRTRLRITQLEKTYIRHFRVAAVVDLNGIQVVFALTSQKYDSPSLIFRPAKKLSVAADPGMDWTLDGEFAKGSASVEIENLHSAVNIVVNRA